MTDIGSALRVEADEKLAGARRALARTEADRTTFATENIDSLISERQPDATAAALTVEAAVAQLGEVQGRWNEVEADVASLLRLAGQSTADIPKFADALTTLMRDARRASHVGVPAPLPHPQAHGHVVTHDGADQERARETQTG